MKYSKKKTLWPLPATTCLFFLCFIVRTGKGDCPRPEAIDHLVLTNEALLLNSFPEGSEVTYECTNGYVIEEGSGTVTCIAGQWSKPEMTCKKKDCGVPKPIPHLKYEVTEGTLFGATMLVRCDDGFFLKGPSYRQCYATGWSGRVECIVVTCDDPKEITNGKIVSSHPSKVEYLETILYACNEGYTLVGNSTLFCNGKGEYSSVHPECKIKTCPTPEIPFSIPTRGEPPFLYNDTASYECEEGHTLQGTSDLVCELNGWSSPFPQCIKDTNSLGTTEAKTTASRDMSTPVFSVKTTSRPSPIETFTVQGGGGKIPVEEDYEEDHLYPRTARHTVVALTVIATLITTLLVLLFIYRFCKRKGSYQTGEDQKAELLQFQKDKYTSRTAIGSASQSGSEPLRGTIRDLP